jgi:hypothetical protein
MGPAFLVRVDETRMETQTVRKTTASTMTASAARPER